MTVKGDVHFVTYSFVNTLFWAKNIGILHLKKEYLF